MLTQNIMMMKYKWNQDIKNEKLLFVYVSWWSTEKNSYNEDQIKPYRILLGKFLGGTKSLKAKDELEG